MLRNLKSIHMQNEDLDKALCVMNRLLIVSPLTAPEWRDRGLLYERLECPRAALDDIAHYLRLAPDAEDAAAMAERMAELRKLTSRLN